MLKQLSLFDDDGTLIRSTTLNGSPNEGEWVIMYRETLLDLALTAPNFTVVKLFLLLAADQEYGEKPIKTTKKALAERIGTDYKHTHKCLKWLEENNYIIESKSNGQTQFDLNPDKTTCGRDRDKKLNRWSNLKYKAETAALIDLSKLKKRRKQNKDSDNPPIRH